MKRTVAKMVRGNAAIDGAGVHLTRVLGRDTIKDFDPILMLDSFDSTNPAEYTAGFPAHPHRGIETISYVYRGKMVHRDSLGNEEAIGDGEVQWMNSGSGIIHEEALPESERLLGVQLWLNLPAKDKMSNPSYRSIKREDIQEIIFPGGMLRLLAGDYKEYSGYRGEHQPFNYYDIHLNCGASFRIDTPIDDAVSLFTLKGRVWIGDRLVEEKTAVLLTRGELLEMKAESDAQVLYMGSKRLEEPVAWAGPIVMNTQDEINAAYHDLRNNTFVKGMLEIK